MLSNSDQIFFFNPQTQNYLGLVSLGRENYYP